MNREEQIRHKASSIRDKMISNDTSVGYALGYEDGYVDGALYSDENPDTQKVYTKKELLEMGFTFDLNGNISTPDECYERAEKYYEYRKRRFIDETCDYLYKNWRGDDFYITDIIEGLRKHLNGKL